MRRIIIIYSLILLNNCLAKAQEGRSYIGKEFAQNELDRVLGNEKKNRVYIWEDPLIKDEEMAIKVVEPILFGKYGQKTIELQKPYEVHKIEKYYIVLGTLPSGYIGGTFVIIIDETNARILEITHYK